MFSETSIAHCAVLQLPCCHAAQATGGTYRKVELLQNILQNLVHILLSQTVSSIHLLSSYSFTIRCSFLSLVRVNIPMRHNKWCGFFCRARKNKKKEGWL